MAKIAQEATPVVEGARSERDALIMAFLDRNSATMEEADALAEKLGPCVREGVSCWVTDFKRRNGVHPMHHGWPMAELSNGMKLVLNPQHECAFQHGQTAIARGIMHLEATNGR